MRFEIEGDCPAILEKMEEYKKQFEDEYRVQVQKAKEMLKGMGMMGSGMLQDELPMFFWEENGKIIINIPVYTPMVIKIFRKHGKMAKGFKGFLEALGVKVKSVKYIGD
jgi:hypothetical protein